jgi:hypothetical protein
MKINNIEISGDGIANTIDFVYPNGNINLAAIRKNKLYNYLVLWGIRVSTCNTGMPDDAIGGIRLKKNLLGMDYWEIMYSDASTDPSPYWLLNPMSDAKMYGGTAWVAEGQYRYGLGGDYNGYPSFRPKEPVKVWRWTPTKSQINNAKANHSPLSIEFETAKLSGQAKLGTSDSVLIHRTWDARNLYKDSAGCQVFANNGSLVILNKWAQEHINTYKKSLGYDAANTFSYTLLTKDEFVKYNGGLYNWGLYNYNLFTFKNY